MTVGKWLDKAEILLRKSGIKSARLDCLILLEMATNQDRSLLLSNLDQPLKQRSIKRLQKYLKQRSDRIPLAYISGSREFFGYSFLVDQSVLIPRPVTEHLAESVLEDSPRGSRILDLGTGSGAIAISMKLKRPDLDIVASDISKPALKLATKNAKRHGVIDIDFINSDLFQNITTPIDILVANLPYVSDGKKLLNELSHEPRIALLGGHDGLDHYRRLFTRLKTSDKNPAKVFIEAESDQKKALARMADGSGYHLDTVKYDFIYKFSRV